VEHSELEWKLIYRKEQQIKQLIELDTWYQNTGNTSIMLFSQQLFSQICKNTNQTKLKEKRNFHTSAENTQ
jgi:hypothetical protein